MALDGIRIFDLSHLFVGNTIILVMADQRAAVIKVERPRVGGNLRNWKTNGISTHWKVCRRNKKASPSTYAQTVAVTYSLIWWKQPM